MNNIDVVNMGDGESRIVMMMKFHHANTLHLQIDSVSIMMTVVDILIAYYYLLLPIITTNECIPKKIQNFKETVV